MPRAPRPLLLAVLGLALAGCGASPAPATPAPAAPAPTTAAAATALPAAPTPTLPAPTAEPIATAAPVVATGTPAVPTVATAPALARPLQLAEPRMEGEDVRAAQAALLGLGYSEVGPADGVFGPQTAAAARRFQIANGLDADGVIGKDTWAALFGAAAHRGDGGADARASVILDAGFAGWVVGGASVAGWIAPAALGGVPANTSYTLYTLDGALGQVSGGPLETPDPTAGPCGDLFTVKLSPQPDATGGARPIAVHAPWNPLPRAPETLAASSAIYRQAVAEWLQSQGIAAPDVRIERIVRVDIEGDGEPEVLISATRQTGEFGIHPAAGDYSFVLLRKVVSGAVQTIQLLGEYYPAVDENNVVGTNRLMAVLDLNGDGRLEMVVGSDYYEGASTLVFELQGQAVAQVLAVGCGV